MGKLPLFALIRSEALHKTLRRIRSIYPFDEILVRLAFWRLSGALVGQASTPLPQLFRLKPSTICNMLGSNQ